MIGQQPRHERHTHRRKCRCPGGTSTVTDEGRESMATDWLAMVLDDTLATSGVSAEPDRVLGVPLEIL